MMFRFWTLRKVGVFFGIAVFEETIPFKTKFEEKPYSVMRV